MNQPQKTIREENAIVLDFLPHGYAYEQGTMKTPIAQALGLEHLSILELIPKKGIFLQPHQKVYIGEGKREEIHHIKGRIESEKLTSTAKNELQHVIESYVESHPQRFIDFFNKAQPLSMRMHQLELLPGLGKKHMWEILEARKQKPFESFDDLKNRVKLLPNPKQVIVKRIISEIEGKEKYNLFIG
ncbi:DNA-binding protein [Candidatus Woesearchaeota archaeon CG10_big_fil_rev_8_21_14_0_10_45_16]|nr:MAG: DNA-binding protein [Candidatus Woesearchaeota archaeon CG10_big_fil_rev_8_21_14_0_10_45_16]